MKPFDLTTYGQDVLIEASFGKFLIEKLPYFGFPLEYRDDSATPVNIVNHFSWVDDPDRYNIVRKEDYSDSRTQVPLPIVGYGFTSDSPSFLELGTVSQSLHCPGSIIVATETKFQSINLSGFLRNLLSTSPVFIYDYNDITDVGNMPKIGVIYCEDFLSTRFFDYFDQPNIATKFSVGITFNAVASFNKTYS